MTDKKKIILIFAALVVIVLAYFLFFYKPVLKKEINVKFFGRWENVYKLKTKEFLLIADISKDSVNNELVFKFSVPRMYAYSIPVDSFNINGDSLFLRVNSLRMEYWGKLLPDSAMIVGKIKVGKNEKEFNFLTKDKYFKKIRPQTPMKPFPYKVVDFKIHSLFDSVSIAGTYTCPKEEKRYPTIILMSGMGPQDRDETMYAHKPFLVLADYFTKLGFGVLRIDDRGMGGSTGNYFAATTYDFASDIISCIHYLKGLNTVDTSKIGLIGFNEGGLTAAFVASRVKNISFTALLATPGLRAKDVLLAQTKDIQTLRKVPKKEIMIDYKIDKQMYNAIAAAKDSSEAAKKLKSIFKKFKKSLSKKYAEKWKYSDNVFKKKLKFLLSPWFRFYVKLLPDTIFSQIKCPTLILYGEKDLQVQPEKNLMVIKNALIKGGNKNVKTMILPGLNHFFQTSDTGLPTEYSRIKETFSPKAMKALSDWIIKVVKKNI